MPGLAPHMARYASHHRHPVNRAIHVVGIPAIVWTVVALLVMATAAAGLAAPVAALAAWAAVTVWYLRLDARIGAVASAALLACVATSWWLVATRGVTPALWWVLGVHAASWVAQFVGHGVWEKKRPALFENLSQTLIAPLFLIAEAAFALGMRRELAVAVGEA